ncbi:phage tail length tape measure family protein [Pectobacterium carotovorum]|uniref:phage tail length tape measure family protein n=1 Tax=Pectobacterium carotovorum TaxID=554 RepID=UPI0030190CD1
MTEQTSRLAIILDSTGAEKNAENLSTALGKMTQAGEKAAAGAGKVALAVGDEREALADLLGQINPLVGAMNKLDKQQSKLEEYYKKGMLPLDEYQNYLSVIDSTRNKLVGFGEQLNKTGMSAKQTAAAMRMVPAQMTDIVVSLAAGQAPLTVLLQQGGQLKDMFGGIAPAAKALGTYIMGLVTPYTLAAGAIGLLTYAVYSNRKEIDEAAKLASTSLGANGEYAERLALNMVAISQKTGEAIDVVSKMFITTKDGASEAEQKLIAVGLSYQEAKEKVDRYKDSSNFTALNASIDAHRREVLGIRDAWTNAAIQAKNYYTGANAGKQSVALGGAVDPTMRIIEQGIDLQKTLNKLRIDGNEHIRATVENVNKEYLSVDRVAAAEKRLSDARKMARDISASGDKEAIATANALIGARQKELDEAIKAANKKPKEKAYTEDAATRLLDQINQQNTAMRSQLGFSDKLNSATQARIKFEQQIADLKSKAQLTADQKSILARSDEILQAYKQQEALQNSVKALDDYRKMQDDVRSKDQKVNDLLKERLALLEKAKATGALQPGEYEKTRSNIIQSTKPQLPESVQKIFGANDIGSPASLNNSFISSSSSSLSGYQDDRALSQIEQLKKAMTDYSTFYQQQQDAITQNALLSTQERNDMLVALEQDKNERMKAMNGALYNLQTQTALNSFSSITDSMGTMFGEQSAAYKAAFVTQKAFAIAQAALQLPMAMGQALAGLPFPANLAAMAQVIGLMASITSSISSAAAVGFKTGGYTGNAGVNSVAGVVHGKEYVFDAAATKRIGVSNLEALRNGGSLDATLSRPGYGTGATSVSNSNANTTVFSPNVNVSNSFSGKPDDATLIAINQSNKRLAKQIKDELTAEIIKPQGNFGNALKGYYARGYVK